MGHAGSREGLDVRLESLTYVDVRRALSRKRRFGLVPRGREPGHA